MLLAAGFFGYMLALLQRRVGTMVSPEEVSSKFGTLHDLSQTTNLKTFLPLLGLPFCILLGDYCNRFYENSSHMFMRQLVVSK